MKYEGRPVEFKMRTDSKTVRIRGSFIQFLTSDAGRVVAVVELSDGTVKVVPLSDFQFLHGPTIELTAIEASKAWWRASQTLDSLLQESESDPGDVMAWRELTETYPNEFARLAMIDENIS